jgi:DNA replication protein DnaC
MQRHEMMTTMAELGLKGMAGAFDEAVTTGLQRKRMTMEILTDLLRAETTHRHAASVRYRMSAAKLPAVKDLDAFVFDGTPINECLVRSLHSGSFLAGQRNIVLVGGTGTGKTHLASAISTMSQWCVMRSSSAAVILGLPKTVGHSPKARFVVTRTEVRS